MILQTTGMPSGPAGDLIRTHRAPPFLIGVSKPADVVISKYKQPSLNLRINAVVMQIMFSLVCMFSDLTSTAETVSRLTIRVDFRFCQKIFQEAKFTYVVQKKTVPTGFGAKPHLTTAGHSICTLYSFLSNTLLSLISVTAIPSQLHPPTLLLLLCYCAISISWFTVNATFISPRGRSFYDMREMCRTMFDK